ncbi:hypothetical protein MAIC_50210 [Mycolicibacterium aichiense]|uniref:Uncharacterized protein n=2 Tax=Mycolicibacterium aichiense TaxID=1799 RepID=A0AAD1ME23_9MYCO|nr:hypothetical protein MAIC_50210 [Mycolicibacterium aichiense]STZ26119.1 Uncharacterised protein [Mycolicibacterium aichiense]
MRALFARLGTVSMVSVLLAAPMLGSALAPASADPDSDVVEVISTEPAPEPPRLIGWPQLGLPDRIDLLGANQPSETAIPVPAGTVPTTLSGVIGAVVNVVSGRVDVLDDRGMVLGTIPVPADATTVPFEIDISPALVANGMAKLSFVIRDNNQNVNNCTQIPALSISQLASSFAGPPTDPASVADYLPSFLDKILINVGPNPTYVQQQAALDLVAQLTKKYRPMPVRIDVTTQDIAPAPEPTVRVIDIRDNSQPGVIVENAGTPAATLVISGTGQTLARQVQLFVDQRTNLAQAPAAVVLSSKDDTTLSSNTKTFDQLGVNGQASVLGVTTIYAGFDVSAFGAGPISSASVHLMAKYTPVGSGQASVLIRSGSTVLATHRLDNSGTLDISGVIPPEEIASNVGLALELRYIPQQECAPLNDRMTFALDGQSTVTVTPGTNNRGGFPVLPMAFTPDFYVTLDSPEYIRYAAQAINLMAQQTSVTLRPKVTTFGQASSSGTGLLAVTSGAALSKAGMKAPLVPNGASDVGVNGDPATDLNVNGQVGAIQAFTSNNRTVLAISATGDWSLVDASFDYIRGLPSRWASVVGDVVATGSQGRTVNMSVNEGGPMARQPNPGAAWKWWAWLSLGIGTAALVIAATVLVIRLRRRTTTSPEL